MSYVYTVYKLSGWGVGGVVGMGFPSMNIDRKNKTKMCRLKQNGFDPILVRRESDLKLDFLMLDTSNK